jgi:transposase
VVRSIRRSKSRVQAVLHANLIPKYAGHLFGKGGRRWLVKAPLPKTERDLLEGHLDELDWLAGRLETLERDLIHISLDDPQMRKLMTVAGISSVIATAVIASIGDISRFATPEKLASYFGLTPRVRQSGDRGAIHGRISKQGNATARTMLVEAAWGASIFFGQNRACGQVLTCVRPRVAASHTPRARMVIRGSGPQRLHALLCAPSGCWFSRPQ